MASFPSKVYKVQFEAQQVTKEMQGVTVRGMMVWTVNRMGEGPYNAYKNLGDLSSGNPYKANDFLTAQATSVVRSCIANSTITEMITNRKLLREAIIKEMFEVVKGQGVWLETVEITGVECCSQSLFIDMQTNFREQKRQEATLYQMQIKSEMDVVQNQKEIEKAEIVRTINEKKSVYKKKVDLELKEAKEQFLNDMEAIDIERAQIRIQSEIEI